MTGKNALLSRLRGQT